MICEQSNAGIVCITDEAYSERGVRQAPELLPPCYKGGNQDEGSIGL